MSDSPTIRPGGIVKRCAGKGHRSGVRQADAMLESGRFICSLPTFLSREFTRAFAFYYEHQAALDAQTRDRFDEELHLDRKSPTEVRRRRAGPKHSSRVKLYMDFHVPSGGAGPDQPPPPPG